MPKALLSRWLPKEPHYDPLKAEAAPLVERLRLGAQEWALHGYGAPAVLMAFHGLKIIVYIGVWIAICAWHKTDQTPLMDALLDWSAFQKFAIWSMLFEILGLGCGSGPLTGRYWPPFGALFHFGRPGTIKLPLFPKLPILGGSHRGMATVGLYFLLLALLTRLLLMETPDSWDHMATLLTLLGLGLADKTAFLAARSEHYGALLLCFCFGKEGVAGAMVVQTAIWLWAALSKLTKHFPSVLCVMSSNSPFMAFGSLRKRLYADFPDDLRPSKTAKMLAHTGSLVEFAFPILLIVGQGGTYTWIGLIVMTIFHLYILSNLPAAVPLEWNVFTIYSGWALFSDGGLSTMSLSSLPFIVLLILLMGAVPLLCNLFPSKGSFLFGMRYYAGNWPYTTWVISPSAVLKLGNIPRASPLPHQQLLSIYNPKIALGTMQKIAAFRCLHLHGRILPTLIGQIETEESENLIIDGELIAGSLLGWNFGDGHLSGPQLLTALQERLQLKTGDIRVICVEAQALFGKSLSWEIHDAATGLLSHGKTKVSDLCDLPVGGRPRTKLT